MTPFVLLTTVSRFEFEWINLAIASLLANQPIVSEFECARDQCQSATVTPPVNLNFSFLSRISRHLIDLIDTVEPLLYDHPQNHIGVVV